MSLINAICFAVGFGATLAIHMIAVGPAIHIRNLLLDSLEEILSHFEPALDQDGDDDDDRVSSDDQKQAPGEGIQEMMSRVSNKEGVLASIVLDRSSGAVIHSTGAIRWESLISNTQNSRPIDNSGGLALNEGESVPLAQTEIDKFAAMVWNFTNAAGSLVHGLDTEDETKLLRLRTKKNELVIVPDLKYILIVVHETAPA